MKIQFSEIHVALKGKEILSGVTITAASNQVTGIAGPNGSGKSTLIKTFFSLVPVSKGTITLEERPIDKISKKHLAQKVAYVGQESPCLFNFTLRELVAMGRYPHSDQGNETSTKAKVDWALKELHLTHLADRGIQNLSGGERKLAYLAKALVQEADSIILDEPTNHLDIQHQLFILDYLKKSGKTILVVIHDLQLATRYCDAIYLLKHGQNHGWGTPGKVLTRENVASVFSVQGGAVQNPSGQYTFQLDTLNYSDPQI